MPIDPFTTAIEWHFYASRVETLRDKLVASADYEGAAKARDLMLHLEQQAEVADVKECEEKIMRQAEGAQS